MKTLASVMGKASRFKNTAGPVDWPLQDQLIGIEVEVESNSLRHTTTNLFPYWNRTTDGSLQNGVEFVLAQPLSGNSLSNAIHQFFSQVQPARATTSGTHIHLDMMEDNTNINTIQCMILLAFILESAVYGTVDASREWCGFTNRLSTAPKGFIYDLLRSDVEHNYAAFASACQGVHSTGKYYGLNVLALGNYGSVEFRYFPTATSPDELISWIKLVQCFKKAALEIGSPSALETIVATERDYIAFITTYFTDWQEDFLKYVPWKTARNNYHRAMAIPQSIEEAAKHESLKNVDSLLKSKRFSKLLKNRRKSAAEPELKVHIALSGHPVPDSMAIENKNAILCYNSSWYLCVDGTWLDMHAHINKERLSTLGGDVYLLERTLSRLLRESSLPPSRKELSQVNLESSIRAISNRLGNDAPDDFVDVIVDTHEDPYPDIERTPSTIREWANLADILNARRADIYDSAVYNSLIGDVSTFLGTVDEEQA